jgi:serine/threonine protein phosphatase 1
MLYDTYIHDAEPLYSSLTDVREKLSVEEQEKVMQWIMDMPECKLITVEGQKFYLNHTQAVSPEYFKEELTDRMFPDYVIYKEYNDLKVKELICIHGHIPTIEMRRWHRQEINSLIWKNKSGTIIDIDCGAGYPKEGGRLGCLRLNDMREFYVEV